MGRQTLCKGKCVRAGPCGQLDVPTRVKIFQKTQNFSKKEKCDERDENLSYSERDCMEILLYCGDCIGEDHKYFCGA